MEVEVSEALKGDPKGANVRIWGDTGILCRPYVTAFPVGTEWVFAVHSNPEKAEGGYVISACGEYAVRVQKDSVTGKLTPTKTDTGRSETMSLKELRTRLRTPVK
jgi:hypothetical protein